MGPFCDMGPLGFQHTLAVSLAYLPGVDVSAMLAYVRSMAEHVGEFYPHDVWMDNRQDFLAPGDRKL